MEAGVFLTRDPAGFVDGPNLYTYVRQNPWSKFDPHGLQGAPGQGRGNSGTNSGWGNKAEDWQNLGKGIASEVTNSQLINDSWELTSGADYSTPMGWVEGA